MMEKRISRRALLRMSVGLAGAAALAACAPKVVTQVVKETVIVKGTPEVIEKVVTAKPVPGKIKKVSFWMWNTYAPVADDVLEKGVTAWAEANGINLVISRDSDGRTKDKVMPAMEAGTLPDAMIIDGNTGVLMAEAKGLLAINDLFKEVGELHGGWQVKLEEYVTRDEGKIWFTPYSIDTPMVQFRQDIFEEAGVDIPEGQWTWEQTRDYAKIAQDYTESKGDKKIGWGFGIVKQQHDGWCGDLFRNFGAFIWDETGTKVILKDENMDKAVRALQFAKGAFDQGLFPSDAASWDWSSNNKSYQEEQCLLVINSASIYTWCKNNKPELEEVTGLAPKPSDVLKTTNASLRYSLGIPKTSTHKEEAYSLLKAMYDKEIYAPWLESGFVTNVVHEYDTLPMWEGKRGAFNQAAQIGVYSGYPAPYDNAAMAELGGANNPEGTMVVRVLVDGWSPEEAIEESDKFAKGVFKKYFG